MDRRSFLQFLGHATIGLGVSNNLLALSPKVFEQSPTAKSLPSLSPSLEDKLSTVSGISFDILIKWDDPINAKERFGFNNDFIAFHSLEKNRAILWVNHEYLNPIFLGGSTRNKTNVDLEMTQVGGSLIEIIQRDSKWKFEKKSKFNRRLDAKTEIPFSWNDSIAGKKTAIGTMGNCAGGKTPWGTILTCEENYDMFWGDKKRNGQRTSGLYKWDSFYSYPPEHYGWVVEVEPLTGKAKKLVSLGRCAHEAAALTKGKNGKVVVYTGDDANDEHLYKFISNSSDSLDTGKLYVANLEKGEWLSLDINDSPILREHFKDQTEIQVYTREAAKLLGASVLARPEDIEFDPLTGHVLIALTNNKPKGNYHGSILKIIEKDNDPSSLKFAHEIFLTGGPQSGFSCPDNMVFDKVGNLWFTSDIAGDSIGRDPYKTFGNNGLYVFMRTGDHAGQIIRVAIAPVDAEFTGPCFDDSFSTLFLSVQHPGEMSSSKKQLTSRWPDGGIPKSCVITLQGTLLNDIVNGKV